MTYNIPILFLVFNRPETTKRVLLEIRKIKPTKLYVVADGPRKNNLKDKENCEKVRNLIDELVDWKCVVKKTYRKENLGCRKSVSEGITWFFKNEEMGVILEDDCLANNSFFKFCEKMLLKYKNNSKIMHISGNTFINQNYRNKYVSSDYFFSKYPHVWGWATWKRAWKFYNSNLHGFDKNLKNILIYNKFNLLEKLYWTKIFNLVLSNKINSWAYVWFYSILERKGLSIQPKYNLVKNIGFGEYATHTTNINKNSLEYFNLKLNKHPLKIESNSKLDRYIAKKHYGISIKGLFFKIINNFKLFIISFF
ncbi:MAG: nucleotide-diphospho-sugar transferase [Candidatus ainarchaeum sp.]|nr:nucleotide-diphospho-sugar transferase [Candidatus ainarchaeum sp.]MDD4220866.1 nucleotide-diphospho-sugar transferase [Candidatus ainarchaeum sp.]MDD4662667.1 nucleotide-diphospho-sugar transferase [Candidatus ainarchaeum sp.]